MSSKRWYASKTLVFNLVSLLIVAASFIAENRGALDLPASTAMWATLVVALGNAWLRLGTNQPITGTPAARDVPPENVT